MNFPRLCMMTACPCALRVCSRRQGKSHREEPEAYFSSNCGTHTKQFLMPQKQLYRESGDLCHGCINNTIHRCFSRTNVAYITKSLQGFSSPSWTWMYCCHLDTLSLLELSSCWRRAQTKNHSWKFTMTLLEIQRISFISSWHWRSALSEFGF